MIDADRQTMTICVKCVHHNGAAKSATWYDHYCHHPELARKQAIDPVTGEKCFWSRNDLGGTHTTDERHPHCRDINDKGECDFYETMIERLGR